MPELSPPERVAQLLSGYWASQMLYVGAKLGLADLLQDGPRTADELAQATQTHAPSLYRLLRGLASLGIFAEQEGRQFHLTPMAECLRSDVPSSQRAMAIMAGELFYKTWGELLSSVRTGQTAFDAIFGMPIFDFLSQHPEQAKLFDQTMVGVHGRETQAMLEAYDFSGIQLLADVGGGNGSVITAILKKHAHLRGILFDLPGVAERARANIQAAGLSERCQVVGGSFFESVPRAEAYLLRHIIHDWDDAKSTIILKNIHQSMTHDGRLLLVESVIPPGNEPSFGKLLDLAMLVLPGGQERTQPEYSRLYEQCGFRLTQIVPTRSEVSVIEGRQA